MSRVVYQMRQCGCLVMSVCLRSNGVAFNSFVKALYGACCVSNAAVWLFGNERVCLDVCLRSNGVAFNSFVKALDGARVLYFCCRLRCGKQVSVEQQGYRQNRFYLAKLRAMVRKLPGFFFSSYRSLAASSALVRRRWFGVGVRCCVTCANSRTFT